MNKSDIPLDTLKKDSEDSESVSLQHHNTIWEAHYRWRYKCGWKNLICVIVITIVCLFVISVILSNKSRQNNNICLTDECLRSAAALKQTMNLKVDPCEDFYEYVCGNWAEERPELPDGNSWYRERQQKIYRNIRAQLERDVRRFDPKPVAQAKMFYQTCLKAGQRKKEGTLEIVQYLHELGLPTIPSLLNQEEISAFDWLSTIAKIQRKIGLDIFVGLYSEKDIKNSNRTQLAIYYVNPENPLKKDEDGEEFNENTKLGSELMKFVDAIDLDFNSTNRNTSYMELGAKYMIFFNDLPKVQIDSEYNYEEENDMAFHYNLQELQSITVSYNAPKESYPIWKKYFGEVFARIPNAHPTLVEKVKISSKSLEYIKNFVKMISQQDPQTIELYIWERVVSYFMWHEFDEKKSKDVCIRHVQNFMELAVSYLISDENFLTSTKPRVEQMLKDIREAFNFIVLNSDWIDAKTKNATLEKSMALRSFIGFPEWIMDVEKLEQHFEGLQISKQLYLRNFVNIMEFSTLRWLQSWRENDKSTWSANPTIVNAWNYLDENAIYIPIAFITYPYYYLGLEAMNYGAIGMTLGHELTHSFDDNGRFFDKSGNRKPWWSTHTHEEYEKRARCMVEQYNSYSLPEGSVNGTLTLAENIADNGGLREAYLAYQAYVKRHGPEPALPGFEGFSHEQLFFIAFAHQDCESLTPEEAKEALEDEHSPSRLRIQGTVSNMAEFSEVFRCAPGRPMNPEGKCRVW